ncbi:MAG: dynamin family protein [Bacteroidota bacterium]
MLTNKLYSFRSYFRSSTKRYLQVLHNIETAKDMYVTALRRMCEACQYNIGTLEPDKEHRDDEWLKNFLPVEIEELHHHILAPIEHLHDDFMDYHENADRFRIVIFGKVNSGKSYLANLLVGKKVHGLKQDLLLFHAILSDGSQIRLEEFEVKPTETTKEIQWCDVETLRVVDLPGVGSISPRNHELAVSYVKKADLVLFLSNSDAVLRGSEFRNIKEDLYGEKKRILFVITQCDMAKDIDTDARIPLKKRDITEMVRYIEATLRNPKYGVVELMKSLDIVPISARLARIGLDMEHHGDRKQGLEQQKDSNIHQLIDRVLHIIADEGKELRILNPLNHTENVIRESMADLHTLRSTLDRLLIFLRNVTYSLHQFHTAVMTHAEAERDALHNFIQHRRIRVDLALDEIFSDTGVNHVLRNQQSTTESITMKFEVEIREELRERLNNALQRWKADVHQECHRFLEDCRQHVEHIKEQTEDNGHQIEIGKDFRNVLTNLITRHLIRQIEQQCESSVQGFQPGSIVTSVSLAYTQPISKMIINGLLSSLGVKFHLKKEKVRKSIRTTILKGLGSTEIKVLELYNTQTRLLDETLQNLIQQLLVERLRSVIHNIAQITNETLKIGRRSIEALETIRKEEI